MITHVTDLVLPHLEGADPASYEGSEQVVAVKFALDESVQDVVDDPELVRLGRHVFEVQLGSRRREAELGQVEGIMALCALHIEERALPLLHRLQTLDPGKHRVCSGRDTHGSAGYH